MIFHVITKLVLTLLNQSRTLFIHVLWGQVGEWDTADKLLEMGMVRTVLESHTYRSRRHNEGNNEDNIDFRNV
jgi:hypothetical protein